MRRARWALVGVVVLGAGAALVEWDRRAWELALAELEGVTLQGGRSSSRTVARARARSRPAARAVRKRPVVVGLLLDRPSEAVEGGGQ